MQVLRRLDRYQGALYAMAISLDHYISDPLFRLPDLLTSECLHFAKTSGKPIFALD